MSHTMLMLVFGGLGVSTVVLAVLGVFIYRETQLTLAFDRRLFTPRRQAIVAGLWSERRERRGPRGGGNSRAFALALVKAVSMVAPVGAAEREKLSKTLRFAGFGQRDALSVFLAVKLAVALAGGRGRPCGRGARSWPASTASWSPWWPWPASWPAAWYPSTCCEP